MQGAKGLSIKNERSVIGYYKADNLTDPDAIYSRKEELVSMIKTLKIMGWFLVLVTPIGLLMFVIPGIVSLCVGVWCILSAKKKINLIEAATNKYCSELGIEAV